jgi:hypothetical protein
MTEKEIMFDDVRTTNKTDKLAGKEKSGNGPAMIGAYI